MSAIINDTQPRTLVYPVRHWQRAVAFVAGVCMMLLQGCATFATAQADQPLGQQINVGDTVRVTTVDGEKREFVVTRMDNDGFYDGEEYLRFTDLTEVKIDRSSVTAGVSTIVVAGIIIGLAAFLLFLNLIEDETEQIFTGN